MAEQTIDLEAIDPNPYQKRIAPSREKVLSIAFSIASDKMLQVPTGCRFFLCNGQCVMFDQLEK